MSQYRPPNQYFSGGNGPSSAASRGGTSQPPKNYVAGLGRGAAGFTTRSDLGPMAAPAGASAAEAPLSGVGSRSAELREAKLRMKQMQQQQQQQDTSAIGVTIAPALTNAAVPSTSAFGVAPKNYVAGMGRGAGMKAGGDDDDGPGGASYDKFDGFQDQRLFGDTPYDEEDEEADKIYAAIDDRMTSKKKRKFRDEQEENGGSALGNIGVQFRELKEKLKDVTTEEWMAIPDVGDYSLRYKQRKREDVMTPITDSILGSRSAANTDATAGNAAMAATTAVMDGTQTSIPNMSGLSVARGTVLGMSLDKYQSKDNASGHTTIDPKGYLTSLSSIKLSTAAEIGDINKARLLLKSVRDTNPKHAPGWIAAARVEEAAGKILAARKIIQEGCEVCSHSEDVWLEAARLHPPAVAKTILATAIRRMPNSVKLFLYAADLETNVSSKKAVFRKALEAIPTSVTLWKAAIELEEADDAKVLLSVAVEKVPQSVEMWLALARLETYENARKVLNQARRKLPAERAVWIAAAKLEESQNHEDMVEKIIEKAVQVLIKHDAVVTRSQWLKEAEIAEAAGAPLTSAAIVKHTLGMGVDVEDRQRTWSDDANSALSRGAVATARAILAHSLAAFPSKRSLWLQAVELERKHGTPASLDEVLAAASERLPRAEIFWLLRAKEKWCADDVDSAREILTKAFAANPDSEAVWLAAAKLEWETGEIERARVLFQRARERAGTDRVYMKSAVLERECKQFHEALQLIEDGLQKYPKFEKLYMMGGQIWSSDDLEEGKQSWAHAREFYQRGIQNCPSSIVLWVLASRLEERIAKTQSATNGGYTTDGGVYTKARSLLELARLKNPKNPRLWVEAIRLERRAGNEKMAHTLIARALQDCPDSGLLLSENISTAPRAEQKSKSADAIKKCPDDPLVISAVASLFASERKIEKARKWFERAVVLDPDIGDSWAKYYAFELEHGKAEQQTQVKERCVKAEPKHGEIWCNVVKDMRNRGKSVAECLELVSQTIQQQKHVN